MHAHLTGQALVWIYIPRPPTYDSTSIVNSMEDWKSKNRPSVSVTISK